MRRIQLVIGITAMILVYSQATRAQAQKTAPHVKQTRANTRVHKSAHGDDIAVAVKAAAVKDCGCTSCAGKGCKPCHGKNCYYCVAKGLVASDCGCKSCTAKGCSSCGPGCDVCKFHLGPVAAAKPHTGKKAK